jgi:hypothetical protein
MELKTKLAFVVAPIVLLMVSTASTSVQSAYAWGGYYPGGYGPNGGSNIVSSVEQWLGIGGEYNGWNGGSWGGGGACCSFQPHPFFWHHFWGGCCSSFTNTCGAFANACSGCPCGNYPSEWSGYPGSSYDEQQQNSQQNAQINIYGDNNGQITQGQESNQDAGGP